MPAPSTPSQKETLENILTEVIALQAAVAAQEEMIEIQANFLRLMYESMFGADVNASGIWDGSDRYI